MDLWSEDECHFQQRGSRYVMWIPPEVKDPIIWHAPTRKQVGMFGAVQLCSGQLFTQSATKFNGDTFQGFLGALVKYRTRNKKMILILDNSRYHHAQSLKDWLREHRKILRLDFLPPYSPKLNPIERVWKLTRRLCTHNRYFAFLEELVMALEHRFALWSKPNDMLRRLCAIN